MQYGTPNSSVIIAIKDCSFFSLLGVVKPTLSCLGNTSRFRHKETGSPLTIAHKQRNFSQVLRSPASRVKHLIRISSVEGPCRSRQFFCSKIAFSAMCPWIKQPERETTSDTKALFYTPSPGRADSCFLQTGLHVCDDEVFAGLFTRKQHFKQFLSEILEPTVAIKPLLSK